MHRIIPYEGWTGIPSYNGDLAAVWTREVLQKLAEPLRLEFAKRCLAHIAESGKGIPDQECTRCCIKALLKAEGDESPPVKEALKVGEDSTRFFILGLYHARSTTMERTVAMEKEIADLFLSLNSPTEKDVLAALETLVPVSESCRALCLPLALNFLDFAVVRRKNRMIGMLARTLLHRRDVLLLISAALDQFATEEVAKDAFEWLRDRITPPNELQTLPAIDQTIFKFIYTQPLDIRGALIHQVSERIPVDIVEIVLAPLITAFNQDALEAHFKSKFAKE